MPLTETDAIRIRQFLQKMQSGLIEGMEVFATYHDSNLASTPSDPTGAGTTGGWHREPTEAANWMSTKTAFKDTSGTWGTPIRVFGLQGTETAGVGLSADIPKLEQITFIGDGSTKVGWTAGTVRYGGNSYAIVVKAVGDGSTNAYIYWDDADGQTSFKTTGVFATAIAAHHWLVCINDGGKAIPAQSARILHGGLIQADTITAGLIQADAIITSKINNLAVETAKIADDATSIYDADSTAGDISCPGSTWTTVATVTNFPSGGGFVQIGGAATGYDEGSTTAMKIGIYEGATLLAESAYTAVGGSGATLRFNLQTLSVPGSGDVTYYLKVYPGGDIIARIRNLIVQEERGK